MIDLRSPFTAILLACGSTVAAHAGAATGDLLGLHWAPGGTAAIPGFAPPLQRVGAPAPPAWAHAPFQATLGASWAPVASPARAISGWDAWTAPASTVDLTVELR